MPSTNIDIILNYDKWEELLEVKLLMENKKPHEYESEVINSDIQNVVDLFQVLADESGSTLKFTTN